MKITRVYTGLDNQAHFEDLGHIKYENAGGLGELSKMMKVSSFRMHRYEENFFEDWHNPPLGPIAVIFLTGKQEIELGNGTKRIFGLGDIVLFEDMTGQGHKTRAIAGAGESIILNLLG
jgi:hypothetical protein